ncbi:hypothetical protein SESBI_42372 [Sesbania bispinosa]|nr:hypothetical protein SESBI_42372 [Sesbania bispinosa]
MSSLPCAIGRSSSSLSTRSLLIVIAAFGDCSVLASPPSHSFGDCGVAQFRLFLQASTLG